MFKVVDSKRGATLLELIVAAGISMIVVFAVTSYLRSASMAQNLAAARNSAMDQFRQIEQTIGKQAERQVSGSVARTCNAARCPEFQLTTTTGVFRVTTRCMNVAAGDADSAAVANSAINGCLATPNRQCTGQAIPVLQITLPGLANPVTFPRSVAGGKIRQQDPAAISGCAIDHGGHIEMQIEQVLLQGTGQAAKAVILKKSITVPRKTSSGIQIE